MFCPYCGVNNDRGEILCFICKKPLPNLEGPSQPARVRPERAAVQESFGSVGDRMLALFFDRVAILGILMMISSWTVSRWGAIDPRLPSALWGGGAIVFLTIFLYHLLFEAAFGTTLGKAMMGLQVRVVKERGRFAAAAIRNLLRIVDAVAIYLIAFLSATFTPRRQRVGDLAAGTVVMESGIGRGARAAMMVLWIALVATAIWVSRSLCPTCRPDIPSTPVHRFVSR
jgi:uncharacterized RDD family membrane protein YckC